MKKQPSTILKGILITVLSVLFIFPVMAQREKREISLLTQDQVKKVADIVKTVKEQIEKQVSGDDRYKGYVEELKGVQAAKTIKEKTKLTDKIQEKYGPYFKEVWTAARVDERGYQEKIRRVFPDNIANLIQFDAYLNFTLLVSTTTKSAAPTPQEPENKCIDVCPIAAGEIKGDATLIASGGGSYGNCFLRTSAWGTGAFLGGWSELTGWLRNGITIPGTFPNDARKLRIKASYEIRLEATSFAALGGGFAQTWINTPQSSEQLVVFAPFIWGMHKVTLKTMNENYLLEKKDIAGSRFLSYANTFSVLGSGNWCFADCSAIKWTICEEK